MNTIIFCNGKSSWSFWRLSIFMVLKESCPCVRETFCTILKMITKNFFGEPTQNTNHDIWWNVMDCTQFSQLLFLIILFRCSYFCSEYHSPVRVFLVSYCVGKKLNCNNYIWHKKFMKNIFILLSISVTTLTVHGCYDNLIAHQIQWWWCNATLITMNNMVLINFLFLLNLFVYCFILYHNLDQIRICFLKTEMVEKWEVI